MAKEEERDGVWRTIRGRRVFIRDGESLSSAMSRSGKFKRSDIRESKFDLSKEDRTNKMIKSDFNSKVQKKQEKKFGSKYNKRDVNSYNQAEKNRINENAEVNDIANRRTARNWLKYSEEMRREKRHENLQKKLADYKAKKQSNNKQESERLNNRLQELKEQGLGYSQRQNKLMEEEEYKLYKRAKEHPETIDPMTENSTDWEALEKKYGKGEKDYNKLVSVGENKFVVVRKDQTEEEALKQYNKREEPRNIEKIAEKQFDKEYGIEDFSSKRRQNKIDFVQDKKKVKELAKGFDKEKTGEKVMRGENITAEEYAGYISSNPKEGDIILSGGRKGEDVRVGKNGKLEALDSKKETIKNYVEKKQSNVKVKTNPLIENDKKVNQKTLKEYAKNGLAKDISNYSDKDLDKLLKKHGKLEHLKTSHGIYGQNGALFKSEKTGEYFVLTNRSSNWYRLV